MTNNRDIEPTQGTLNIPMDVENREFLELQLLLKKKAESLNQKQKLALELFALQVKMEDYLNDHEGKQQIVTVGEFLRLYLDKLGLKQNEFATYIGLDPTNFNKILSGKRKVNFELSYKLSQLFNLDPKSWVLIQVKNEYLELKKNKGTYFQQFKLEDLLDV